MTYASILAAVSGAPDDASAVAIGADLAARQSALLKVLTAFSPVDSGAWAYGSGVPVMAAQVVQALAQARRDLEVQTRTLVAHEAARFGLTCGTSGAGKWSMANDAPTAWLTLAHALPLTDLVVVAQSAAQDGPWTGVLSEALMAARAPVLVARGGESAFGRPAAIAWDGSLEAGRAMRAAIPLLKGASEVAILQDPEGLDPPGREGADPNRLIEYLGHHGVGPITVMKLKGRDEGDALLRAASSAGAALLVAGAFGHARLREAVFGGATRSFLRANDGPHLLLCH